MNYWGGRGQLFGISVDFANIEDLERRTKWRYIYTEHYRDTNIIRRRSFSALRRAFLFLQRKMGCPKRYAVKLYKGDNWFSATEDCVRYLVAKREWMLRNFRWTHAPDEIAIPTVIMNSPFAQELSSSGSMRKIDWQRGTPYTWTLAEREELLRSECLFARKFSSANMDVVRAVEEFVGKM